MALPVNVEVVRKALKAGKTSKRKQALSAITKARQAQRLGLNEISAILYHASDVEKELFAASSFVRKAVYGRRMILFAPLYWSSFCVNNCLYCGFRHDNAYSKRIVLSEEEILNEVKILASRGYRRILLESGEDPTHNRIEYLCGLMRSVYALCDERGRPCIDRINVNIAATTIEHYRKLRAAGMGTYNLFQETYHQPTYEDVHPQGPKHNYVRQVTAHDRALKAGIGDVGLGVLWGLYDWRFEIIALIEHARYLERMFGIGPHTFSVPRLKPACGVDYIPPCPVSDEDLLHIVAILRIAVPYAGVVISTRESASLRRTSFLIGVSQTSAGSSTEVGGYAYPDGTRGSQFALEDHRGLEEVVRELLEDGFIPAFCTACEQRGRTGINFMRLAKTGFIGTLCNVNSLLALQQYVADGTSSGFVSKETAKLAEALIETELCITPPFVRVEIEKSLECIRGGTLARERYI